jgi:hypothetical protein
VAELNFIIALRVRCCNILFIITEGKITSFWLADDGGLGPYLYLQCHQRYTFLW